MISRSSLKNFRFALFGLGALLALPAPAVRGATRAPVLTPGPGVEIAGSSGKFDFLEIDPLRHRLLASHEKDGTADFIDLDAHRLIARVKLGPAVCMAVDPRTGDYFVSVSDDNRVAVVDPRTLKETASIATPGPLDALVFDPRNRSVFVANDDGSHVWIIDADTRKLTGAIDIPGAPEYMLYDAGTDRIYLNIKTRDEVVAIDPNTRSIVAHWATAPATSPHGLAFDPQTGRLFSAGANGKLAVIDLKAGRVIATAKIVEGVDQIAFDVGSKRVYCAGPGRMSVVQETPDGAKLIGSIATAPTAKNVAVDPQTHAVWTTCTDGVNSYAKSWQPAP